jgi:hypothetical protein
MKYLPAFINGNVVRAKLKPGKKQRTVRNSAW